ncbi:ABC transporter permease subunit, partial [Lusitaniella coriacea LEGE 07157]|nr:ABC transporter permease subunit [Lusitaniella coriacea LEGE 07157]
MLNEKIVWGLFCCGAIALSLSQTGIFRQPLFNPDGLPLLGRFLLASFHPNLSPDFLRLTLDATLTTLAYGVCGTFLSVVFGFFGGIFASQVWWFSVFRRVPKVLWVGLRALLAAPRAVHEMLWGLLFINIWGLDPLVAIGAIALSFGTVVAKVFSEILDETPRQPLITLLNSGVSPPKAFLYTLIPQAFLNLLSYAFYRFECSIRSAAVLGIIGAGGLGYQIYLSLQSLRYEELWTLFYALIFLNGTVDFTSAWVRDRLGCPSRLEIRKPTVRQDNQTDISPASPSPRLPLSASPRHPVCLARLNNFIIWG